MCGICGFIDKKGKKIDFGILKRMNDTLIRRGPDDEGYYLKDNVGLAMRRLSIIDIKGGKQPIVNEDKSIWVIFNGEIYNYIELRKNLEKKGHVFRTNSDTEVIVHLYEEKGECFPEYLNGMFAIALWDEKNKKLILTRDRAGEKPLYYGNLNNMFIFASELKAILMNPYVSKEIDFQSLNLYLTLEYVPSPFSIIKGIKKLKPGHILIYKDGKISIKSYWKVERKEIVNEDVMEYLDEAISDSVRIRLRSDVPLGIFLSGGIDSSTITYYAKKFVNDIKTFNISFKDPSFDESKYAKMVSRFLGTEHIEEVFDESKMLEILPSIFDFLDEPLADASIIPTYLLSSITRNYVKVALGGDGGDELFGGYPTYFSHVLMDFFMLFPNFLRNFISFIGNRLPVSHEDFSFDFKVKKFLEGNGLSKWKRHIRWMGSFWEDEKTELFKPEIYELSKISLEKFIEETVSFYPKNIDDFLKFDFKTYLSEDVLVKVDRASMAVSLEVRAPFLDRRIIEFIWNLEVKNKVKGWKTKVLLKKLMRKKLPLEVIKRPKKGFGIPIAKWITGALKKEISDTFEEAGDLFNLKYLRALFKEHMELKKNNRKKIWTVYIFLKWKDRYMKLNL